MKFNIIKDLIQGIVETAAAIEAPTKKDRENYMKNGTVTYVTRKKPKVSDKATVTAQR